MLKILNSLQAVTEELTMRAIILSQNIILSVFMIEWCWANELRVKGSILPRILNFYYLANKSDAFC